MNNHFFSTVFFYLVCCTSLVACHEALAQSKRPNILFVISDDQSFGHTSFSGSSFIATPGFDRVASEGIYFTNAYTSSPGCAPSRGSIVTGRYPWQNEQSGQHNSSWMNKYVSFIDELVNNGYASGRTGKGVDPFEYAENNSDSLFRKENAAGESHSSISYNRSTDNLPSKSVSNINYFENFKYFMEDVRGDKPFIFWFGANEPHRAYEKGSWKKQGKKLSDVTVPKFLPDTEEIRGDLLDYAVEIEWFDSHLKKMIAYLEKIGELENTIIIVTSDNGMPFPRAKANSFEYGVHVPLAIRYPKKIKAGRTTDDLISFVDFAPTLLELTQTTHNSMMPISGKSFLNILESNKEGKIDPTRNYSFAGRERHSSARYDNLGYPQRAVFTNEYALIWNMKPERWPAGDPQQYNPKDTTNLLPIYGVDQNNKYIKDAAFTDVDDSPSKTFLILNREKENIHNYFEFAFGKRPEYELYNIKKDPDCITNLADNLDSKTQKTKLLTVLKTKLLETKDPRLVGENPEVFETYKRYSKILKFPKPE